MEALNCHFPVKTTPNWLPFAPDLHLLIIPVCNLAWTVLSREYVALNVTIITRGRMHLGVSSFLFDPNLSHSPRTITLFESMRAGKPAS